MTPVGLTATPSPVERTSFDASPGMGTSTGLKPLEGGEIGEIPGLGEQR
jgi:hypothetical protein